MKNKTLKLCVIGGLLCTVAFGMIGDDQKVNYTNRNRDDQSHADMDNQRGRDARRPFVLQQMVRPIKKPANMGDVASMWNLYKRRCEYTIFALNDDRREYKQKLIRDANRRIQILRKSLGKSCTGLDLELIKGDGELGRLVEDPGFNARAADILSKIEDGLDTLWNETTFIHHIYNIAVNRLDQELKYWKNDVRKWLVQGDTSYSAVQKVRLDGDISGNKFLAGQSAETVALLITDAEEYGRGLMEYSMRQKKDETRIYKWLVEKFVELNGVYPRKRGESKPAANAEEFWSGDFYHDITPQEKRLFPHVTAEELWDLEAELERDVDYGRAKAQALARRLDMEQGEVLATFSLWEDFRL